MSDDVNNHARNVQREMLTCQERAEAGDIDRALLAVSHAERELDELRATLSRLSVRGPERAPNPERPSNPPGASHFRKAVAIAAEPWRNHRKVLAR